MRDLRAAYRNYGLRTGRCPEAFPLTVQRSEPLTPGGTHGCVAVFMKLTTRGGGWIMNRAMIVLALLAAVTSAGYARVGGGDIVYGGKKNGNCPFPHHGAVSA